MEEMHNSGKMGLDVSALSAAEVNKEIPVLVRSPKSSILSSTSFQMNKAFWRGVSTAVEQSGREANMVAKGDGKFGPQRLTPESLPPKKCIGVLN